MFAGAAVIETIHNGPFGHLDPEPLAMLVVVICLGYVVVKHVFHSERRMAAVGRELETARQIQQSILPKNPPSVAGLSVATHYDSMAEVAGDLFDFVITPSGQLGVLVADVSGHGVPAAIVASMVKIALAVQEGEISDPGLVLTRMNRALCGRFELAYVTAVFALIDPAAGTLTYASAGHPSPLLRRAGGALESLDERGIVLGFLPDAAYTSAVVRDLAAGDRVVFYTDGITEAARPDGEFFGDREFQQLLAGGSAHPAGPFMAGLVDAARRWVGMDFNDDVTVVVVDRVLLHNSSDPRLGGSMDRREFIKSSAALIAMSSSGVRGVCRAVRRHAQTGRPDRHRLVRQVRPVPPDAGGAGRGRLALRRRQEDAGRRAPTWSPTRQAVEEDAAHLSPTTARCSKEKDLDIVLIAHARSLARAADDRGGRSRAATSTCRSRSASTWPKGRRCWRRRASTSASSRSARSAAARRT